MKFPANTNIAENRLIPTNKGRSLLIPASTTAFPKPGYEKIVSAKVEPPNISAKEPNCSVIAGNHNHP